MFDIRHLLALSAVVYGIVASVPDAVAVKAWPGILEGKLESGETVRYKLVGDENGHMMVSLDGMILEKRGQFLRATDPFDMESVTRRRKAQSQVKRIISQGFPTTGDLKGIIILAEFADNSFVDTHDAELFHKKMNAPGYSENGATGSARDYFIDQSSGLFTPEFDVVGPVKLSNRMHYYGQNDHNGQDLRPGAMIKEACELAKEAYDVDFSKYDYDDDGNVDFVYVIYAGYAESYGAPEYTIWPHASELNLMGVACELDGKKIERYACSSELKYTSGEIVEGIGAFCHEFGHVIGLPDLYDIYNLPNVQLGIWDIMDQGSYNNDSNTPPAYSAFERASLGWLTLTELDTPADRIELPELTSNNCAYVVNTPISNEFFVLENRQQIGWDKYLPGKGLMITHITYDRNIWEMNMVNSSDRSRWDLVEADGIQGSATYEGDLFPYGNNDKFTDYSSPASLTWNGTMTEKGISMIRDEDGLVSFRFMMDRLATPQALGVADYDNEWIELSWQPVENADSYRLNVGEILTDEENPLVFEENFDRFENGGYPNAEYTDLAYDLDDYTILPGWRGSEIYQAGGLVQLGRYGVTGSLKTPALSLAPRTEGYTVALRVKSYPGKSVNFSLSLIDATSGETIGEITDKATKNEKDIVWHLDEIPAGSAFLVSTNNERLFIDSMRIVKGDTDADKVWQLGEKNWSIEGIEGTSHRVTGLISGRTYRFSVEALSNGTWHASTPSEEITATTKNVSSAETIQDLRELLSVKAIDLSGTDAGNTRSGFRIIIKTYSDGSVTTEKVMIP